MQLLKPNTPYFLSFFNEHSRKRWERYDKRIRLVSTAAKAIEMFFS